MNTAYRPRRPATNPLPTEMGAASPEQLYTQALVTAQALTSHLGSVLLTASPCELKRIFRIIHKANQRVLRRKRRIYLIAVGKGYIPQ